MVDTFPGLRNFAVIFFAGKKYRYAFTGAVRFVPCLPERAGGSAYPTAFHKIADETFAVARFRVLPFSLRTKAALNIRTEALASRGGVSWYFRLFACSIYFGQGFKNARTICVFIRVASARTINIWVSVLFSVRTRLVALARAIVSVLDQFLVESIAQAGITFARAFFVRVCALIFRTQLAVQFSRTGDARLVIGTNAFAGIRIPTGNFGIARRQVGSAYAFAEIRRVPHLLWIVARLGNAYVFNGPDGSARYRTIGTGAFTIFVEHLVVFAFFIAPFFGFAFFGARQFVAGALAFPTIVAPYIPWFFAAFATIGIETFSAGIAVIISASAFAIAIFKFSVVGFALAWLIAICDPCKNSSGIRAILCLIFVARTIGYGGGYIVFF